MKRLRDEKMRRWEGEGERRGKGREEAGEKREGGGGAGRRDTHMHVVMSPCKYHVRA